MKKFGAFRREPDVIARRVSSDRLGVASLGHEPMAFARERAL
jgi:hypothetical protein